MRFGGIFASRFIGLAMDIADGAEIHLKLSLPITRSLYPPCSSKNFSTSMAAAQPEPAAVTAWR